LLGERSDVSDLMSAADAFVMSSAWEGLPLVLLEASASSLPIVTTDVGGNREAVSEGISGYVVPARDPAALSLGMQRLLDLDHAERLAMGAAARALMASTFDMTVVSARWQAIYGEHLKRRVATGSVG
jgi:glycosyltransferase involved in cell wall biosynthesis